LLFLLLSLFDLIFNVFLRVYFITNNQFEWIHCMYLTDSLSMFVNKTIEIRTDYGSTERDSTKVAELPSPMSLLFLFSSGPPFMLDYNEVKPN
ncbi:hypothetical protein HMI55_003862, partial [Coelomomyces lativittatus]